MSEYTSVSNSIIIRIKLDHSPGGLAKVATRIAELGGNIGAIDIINVENGLIVRDVAVNTSGEEHADQIVDAIKEIDAITVVNVSDRTFLLHLGGKLEVISKIPIKTRDELSMAYTPGVAKVCMAIHKDEKKAFNLTIKKNTIAIVSDGTAVLGLGDIGPYAAMPVMEGKAMLLKDFAGVDAFPICLDTKDTEEIILIVKNIAPGFGGINLEDISAPRCFEIERRLNELLDIPVFHDDQHGTAVVLTAAVINSLKVVKKKAKDLKVIVVGTGAAGTACTDMLLELGMKNIIGCDRKGALSKDRKDLEGPKKIYMEKTNPNNESGSLTDVIKGADMFVGLSGPGVLSVEQLETMAKGPMIFAMSNPTPEIMPEDAAHYASIIGTGRSDYPNQINNVLCFPGIFKGALESRATDINSEMKMAAAKAIASSIPDENLVEEYIVPSVFDKNVVLAVTKAVIAAAKKTGVARRNK
ncbi:MAG: NAD-dependent malic enzyme [Lentisphaeria bacterium]|nr:NAD-dependent malic enzyme [Lentisphaeria bacterium]NQZ69200.1 NAD-dependent malic enzyme [Lentisphaeria bacterium]